jgi:hypothetical protein
MTGTTFDCAANGGVARLLTDAPDDVATFEAAPWASSSLTVSAPWSAAASGADAALNSTGG